MKANPAQKLEEAKAILIAFGMPERQQNLNAVYSLLAFAGVAPNTPWSGASAPELKPHDVIVFADQKYKKQYKENTRETIRRQAIHQFVQGAILVRNPSDPTLATNSPNTHYALSPEALKVIQVYGTPKFEAAVAQFREQHNGGLAEVYAKRRKAANVVVTIDDVEIDLSPGAHNELQAAIVREFRAHFALTAKVLYLGDTDKKSKYLKKDELAAIGLPITKHDKLPDVVMYDATKEWLYLIEAVTTHGPVNAKRHFELEAVLQESKAGRIYVSAFPSFREFKKYASDIAWETEVWIADCPEHMLHFNGDRFIGPR